MTDNDINVRLIKIEQRMENLIRELNEDKLSSKATHVKIFDALEVLKAESSKNKGFFGGIVFAVGACFAVIIYIFGKHS